MMSTNNQGKAEVIQVDGFVKENTLSHHTSDYENKALVLRRGGKFKLALTFSGIEFPEIAQIYLRFSIDSKIRERSKIITEKCTIVQELIKSKWCMVIVEKDETQLKLVVEINIPVNAIIGRYSMDVYVPTTSKPLEKKLGIIVLFNPWNKDDEVYCNDEKLRNEYVLNDSGIIYRGSSGSPTKKHWNFGQFEENVLDCVLVLLDKDRRAETQLIPTLIRQNSAVHVSRRLSAVLNESNDDGLLAGNWSGDYEGGKSPMKWSGSVEIFQQYFPKQETVKYGQCWVFSGVMTTALRALGIPARSVTNFNSAHDTDGTVTIDTYYNECGVELKEFASDSVWNFHVWNEIWVKLRLKKFPKGSYDGWQTVDSTPQEESAKLYQMGPAPLKAVKNGEINVGFDTGFVFGEVNADRITWIMNEDEYIEGLCNRKKGSVGKSISTKQPGTDERDDITHLYKHKEGTEDERKAFDTAFNLGTGSGTDMEEFIGLEQGTDLIIDLDTKPARGITIGDSFTCLVDIKSRYKDQVTLNLTCVLWSMEYNSDAKMKIKTEKMENIVMTEGTRFHKELDVNFGEYLGKMDGRTSFKLVVIVKVQETYQYYIEDDMIYMYHPESVDIEFLETPLQVGKPSKAALTFTNHMSFALSNIEFSVEGAALLAKRTMFASPILPSGGDVKIEFDFTPRKAGLWRKLIVTVDTNEIEDFSGYATCHVNEAPEE